MRSEDETDINQRFIKALTGRYEPLKPAKAIARCLDFIGALRADHLPWAEIDRLFNNALEAQNRDRLSEGSVSRLYHVEIRRRRLAAPRQAHAASTPPNREPGRPQVYASSMPANVSATSTAPGHPEENAPTDGPAAAALTMPMEIDSHLRRLEERRAANKRMDEA